MLSAPRDRRLLVEEAAGLGKHRKRRRRAQLKLERTQDNLDRALDVEREARKSLRPLKRQAEAADIHARLEREAAELRARLLASELHGQDDELADAERERRRGARTPGPSSTRSSPRSPERRIGDRGAARRARERAHRGLGPADRRARRARAHQRPRRGARQPPRRACCGALSAVALRSARSPTSLPPRPAPARATTRSAPGIERIGESLAEAHRGARPRPRRGRRRRAAPAAWQPCATAADRAAQMARRVEDMLGSRAPGLALRAARA